MTETEIEGSEPAETPVVPPVAVVEAPPKVKTPKVKTGRGGAVVSLFLFVLILLLAGGEVWLWKQSQAAGHVDVAALQGQIDALKAAQAAPVAAPANVIANAPAVGAAPTAVAAVPSAADQAQTAQVSAQVAAMAPKLSALSAQVNAMGDEVTADHGIVTGLQSTTANLNKMSDHMAQLQKLGAARAALDSGQPVGVLPGAPAALAQFATTAPPREAALRLSFADAARAAESASVTADGKPTFWSRVKARMEGLITISDGTHVLMGAPAAGVLEQARVLLDAGDLKDAVAQIDTLSAPTQAAMGDWLSQARALLAARAAVATMSGQS